MNSGHSQQACVLVWAFQRAQQSTRLQRRTSPQTSQTRTPEHMVRPSLRGSPQQVTTDIGLVPPGNHRPTMRLVRAAALEVEGKNGEGVGLRLPSRFWLGESYVPQSLSMNSSYARLSTCTASGLKIAAECSFGWLCAPTWRSRSLGG